jgi:glycosyltransferase involved in cell wall biosynthesis
MSEVKVAIVHDWLNGMRGGEAVLEAILELFPHSDLFTLVAEPQKVSRALRRPQLTTSFLQKIPGGVSRYRHFLPLMPKAIESLDLRGYDLVLSSSHCVAKGVLKSPGAFHAAYVHAPMRYIWDRYDDYFGADRASFPVRLAAASVRSYLQDWDRDSSSPQRLDHIISNSRFIAERVKEFWRRDSDVVHPFADLSRFGRERQPGKNYIMVGAFAPYKRVDLAVEAFNRMKLPLLIVGSGQDEHALKKMAGPTVDFLGALSNEAITDLLSKARAFVFPGLEDFGITPVEAMAAGCPVIAFGEGGAAETVTDASGVFFRPQTVEALTEAVMRIESGDCVISAEACRKRAAHFSKERFQQEYLDSLQRAWERSGRDPKKLPRRDLDSASG